MSRVADDEFQVEWHPEVASHDSPIVEEVQPRTYFTMVAHGRKLFFFGGFSESKRKLNDVHSYDTETKKWSLHETVGGPPPVYLHSASVHHGMLYVFGGSDGHDSNTLHMLNLNSFQWTEVQTTGRPPSARYGHNSVICGNKLYVVAGCKPNSQYLQDTHELNLATMHWKELGPLGIDTAYHSLFSYRNRCFLFGGFNGRQYVDGVHSLDVDAGTWAPMATTGTPPPRLCGTTTTVVGHHVWVFGGYSPQGHINQIYRLDMESATWSRVSAAGFAPTARAYLQAAHVSRSIYIFGGYDGAHCVSDFQRLITEPTPEEFLELLSSKDPAEQAAMALRHFDKDADKRLNYDELVELFECLAYALLPPEEAAPAHVGYPFDTSLLEEAMMVGFEESAIINCMKKMFKAGQDTTNMNLLLDRLVVYDRSQDEEESRDRSVSAPPVRPKRRPWEPRHTNSRAHRGGGRGGGGGGANGGGQQQHSAPAASADVYMALPELGAPALVRKKSERAELRERLEQVMEENNDMRKCKVCFEHSIDIVLRPCGHVVVCSGCATNITKRKKKCPICKKRLDGTMKIYW